MFPIFGLGLIALGALVLFSGEKNETDPDDDTVRRDVPRGKRRNRSRKSVRPSKQSSGSRSVDDAAATEHPNDGGNFGSNDSGRKPDAASGDNPPERVETPPRKKGKKSTTKKETNDVQSSEHPTGSPDGSGGDDGGDASS